MNLITRTQANIQAFQPERESCISPSFALCLVAFAFFYGILSPSLAHANTPPGTVITNTASLNYQVNSNNMAAKTSNTDSFTVIGSATVNQGHVTATLNTSNLFAGMTIPFDIELKNEGSNSLNSGQLTIDLAESLSITINHPSAILQSQNTLNGITTYHYTVDPLAISSSTIYPASLVIPAAPSITNSNLTILYRANSAEIDSNTTALTLKSRTNGVLQLLQYSADSDATPLSIQPTDFMQANGLFAPIPVPIVEELGISATSAPITLKPASSFSHKQIIFIKLEDADHNVNPMIQETIVIDFSCTNIGETERLRLTETSINSGVFTGYITLDNQASPVQNNGSLEVIPNSIITAGYTDSVDNSDSTSQVILVDPFGILFDSSTGALLNGYTIAMVNADTGQPAQVFGDDGVSTYPATLITGGSVTDSGGTFYDFADGAYRFPFAPVGNYHLVVTPPSDATYTWPSQQTDALINQLPNAPYAITLGSRGETFPLTAGPPLHIDIPLDRRDSPLYIRRSANLNAVSPGDFILFTVAIENVDSVDINQVVLTERLPRGFRLEPKSTLINGQPTPAPVISGDGQTFTFSFGTLTANTTLTLEYVAAIGTPKQGVARSSSFAQGNSGAAQSNTATLKTLITEKLMRSRAILMGQVIIDTPESTENDHRSGLKGVRIYMEDGRYALTDERGMYHFDNVKPGTHVVQLDLDTLPQHYEAVLSENNTRFSGRAWSQFVDVQGGTVWRTDFYVAEKPKPQGNLSLQIRNSALQNNNELRYSIVLENQTVAVSNLRLTVMIPPNVHYKPQSSHWNEQSIQDPSLIQNMLTFQLDDLAKNSHKTLNFTVSGVDTHSAEMISKAFIVFDTPEQKNQRTPVVTHTNQLATIQKIEHIHKEFALGIQFDSADDQIKENHKAILAKFAQQVAGLHNLKIHAVGHSDNRKLLPKTKLRFKDNVHLSERRATIIANELRDLLKLPPSRVTVEGRGAKQPIASNDTAAGRKANRRVHLYVYSDKIEIQGKLNSIQPKSSEPVRVKMQGTHLTEVPTVKTDAAQKPPELNAQWLAQQSSQIKWLQPQEHPDIASTSIAIQHQKDQKITLLKSGKPVDSHNFESTTHSENGNAISRWRGVDLHAGSNHFEAIAYDQSGNEIKRLQRNIHFATDPVRAEVVPAQSNLIADGIQKPVIAIRLLDESGFPVRKGVQGEYRIAPPYQAQSSNSFKTEVMLGILPDIYQYQVAENGVALITLEPTTESGDVQITLPFTNNRNTKLKAKLTAQTTPWILVGLAEGTLGYETLTQKSVALTEDESKDRLYQDNRIAFFAKGKIKGEWLLTIAYDSTKKRPNETDPELFQTIDPDTYYTLYGDTAYNGYAAPSSEPLYLKLEQDQFYFLFGDYQTAFNETQLSKYNRSLTGVKSHYQDERYDVIVFASQTNQAFMKDEFRGNGLTGPYQLTRNNIAMNSEQLVIEVRDRLHSEKIISTQTLSRHQDYQIDYQTGVITFRTPIFSTDQDMNPQYIVVKYESFDAGDRQTTYGARAKMAVNEQLTLGVTHINEGRTGGEATLEGVDLSYQLNQQTKITLEAAQSVDNKVTQATTNQGMAYATEIIHQTERSHSKLYLREQDADFGLGQTNASEQGLRKAGVETAFKIHDNLTLNSQAYQQKSTVTDLTRNVVEAEGRGKLGETDLRLGLRTAEDQEQSGNINRSQQITAGASHQFLDNKLTAKINREQNINQGDSSIDFPDRTRLGVSYRVAPKTSLFIEQDITDGALNNTQNTLVGIKSSPWQGGEVYSGVTQSTGSEGSSTTSNVSARQTWQLDEMWRLDVGAEEVKLLDSSQSNTVDSPFTSNSPQAFTAGSIGITYFPKSWMWTARAETRNGTQEDLWRLATSIQTNPSNRLSTLTTLALSNRQQSNGALTKESALRLGLAYRPLSSLSQGNWLLLNKLDLKWSDLNQGALAGNDWRVINNFNANYKRDRWQLALQYAAKTVNETINNTEYTSFTDLAGLETRYDFTPKWDIGLHGNVLRSVSLNQYDYNTGLSVGRTVADNIWGSLGYNFTGFYDQDFSRSANTSQGAFLRFRIKFDQATVRDAVQWVGQ